jgi:hypothetical protein
MNRTKYLKPIRDNGEYVRWSIGTGLAFVFSYVIGGIVALPLIDIVPRFIHGLVFGAVLGLCVGLAQTKLLPLNYPIQQWTIWVLLSGVAGSINFLTLLPIIEHNFQSTALPDILAGISIGSGGGAICGLLLGGVQWLLLRSSHQRMGHAIIANIIGWTLGWGLLGGLLSWATNAVG